MRFQIARSPKETERTLGVRFMLEKILDDGTSILLATFDEESHAIGALTMFINSLEARRGAALHFGSFTTNKEAEIG